MALWCQPLLHGRQNSQVGASCVLSLLSLAPQGLRLEEGDAAPAGPASLVLEQQLFSSPQGSSKVAATAPSSQRRQKLFCLGQQNKAKPSKSELHPTMECLGREALKNAHERAQNFPLPGATHTQPWALIQQPFLGIKGRIVEETIIVS